MTGTCYELILAGAVACHRTTKEARFIRADWRVSRGRNYSWDAIEMELELFARVPGRCWDLNETALGVCISALHVYKTPTFCKDEATDSPTSVFRIYLNPSPPRHQ